MLRGTFVTLLISWNLVCPAQQQREPIVLENDEIRLSVSPDGHALSLLHKPTGTECLDRERTLPLCTITQYRPYDNENFLMFPAKPRIFPSNKVELIGDTLRVEFEDTYDIAYISVEIAPTHLGFSLSRIDYVLEDYGVKRKTEIDEFALLRLPVKPRENLGEWLNVTWDDDLAVALVGTSPDTRIDTFSSDDGDLEMYAGLVADAGFMDRGAALVICPPNEMLSHMDNLERCHDMPLGAMSRMDERYPCSYYELRDVTTANIDEHLSYAKACGFQGVMVYYTDFAKACGHFEWKDSYPGGMEDLKEITRKITEAGLTPGLHFHYSKVAVTDPYINSGVPDSRMNTVRTLTLSQPIQAGDSEIFIEENPEGLRLADGRRLLLIGSELVSYSSYDKATPHRLLGCRRGLYNSVPTPHAKGEIARLLDVDDWPLFIRINQDTGIQKEIAERLGRIYNECGFRFAYFDGAEDVPMPYWRNVSRSQLTVYSEFEEPPIFAEGALKSHYGWHILSRGNAFDLFPPDKVRQAMRKYVLRCTEQVSKDFSSVNFGWLDCVGPNEHNQGMQPDTYEYVCSKALAWDCPVSLVARLEEIRSHPRMEDNFRVMRDWEEAKLSNAFTKEEKELLKDPDKEYILFREEGKFHFYECRPLSAEDDDLRAFYFSRGGKHCIVCWSCTGSVGLTLPVGRNRVTATDVDGNKLTIRGERGMSAIAVSKRSILSFDMTEEDVLAAFQNRTERR